ncbi:MAG TPA: sulfotransferase domain-containing protein [Allosphingosinicella sp.]|nr:sulfotransferase domain-containing protein [Allosphingosinicella sp.]
MTPVVWLASYPKSGNTWMRVLLANLLATGEGLLNINTLSRRYGIASSRALFEDYSQLDSALLTEDEVDRLRPAVYLAWATDLAARADEAKNGGSPRHSERVFVKCHDAYTRLEDGTPLLGGSGAARGAVVVVRDPRDIAISLANQRGSTVDQAIDLMLDPEAILGRSRRGQIHQLPQRLLDWSSHVSSWLDQCDIPIHIVRYEDLQADAGAVLAVTARFAGLDVTNQQASKAAEASTFQILRCQEDAHGFAEARPGSRFFRHGKAGTWRTGLTRAQAERIEFIHGATMARLGYPIAGEGLS